MNMKPGTAEHFPRKGAAAIAAAGFHLAGGQTNGGGGDCFRSAASVATKTLVSATS